MTETTTPTFRLRRLGPGEAAPSPPQAPLEAPPPLPPQRPRPTVEAPPPASIAGSTGESTGALFPSPQAALTFLGLIAGAGLTDSAGARRGPDGRWWVEAPLPPTVAAPHVAAAGGRIFDGPGFVGAPRLADWPAASLGYLVSAVPLRPATQIEAAEVVVVTGTALGDTVLRRAAAFGLAIDLVPSLREPAAGGPVGPAMVLRLRWSGARPPRSLLLALARLPDTLVARPVAAIPSDPASPVQGLLVDIRHHPPPAAALIAALVPAGEAWLLGGPDAGHWRLENRGPAVDGMTLLAAPETPTAPAPVVTTDAAPPAAVPLTLRLIPDEAAAIGAADAVLLEDEELAWTRRFLIARPAAAETAYLLPGPGRHLLLAPGGLLDRLPFGIGLRQFGNEPLLVEQGQAFYPPLPAAARAAAFAAAFAADEGEVVAVARIAGGLFAARYALSALQPVWRLWLAEPPPVTAGISGPAAQRLLALAKKIDQSRPKPDSATKPPLLRRLRRRPESRDELLRRALSLEAAGRLVAAAEALEQAGEPVRAARLYERAAGEAR